ncbi:MAG: NEW3 domain-containing protein [Candidatus Bathyarchaeia archaeon]
MKKIALMILATLLLPAILLSNISTYAYETREVEIYSPILSIETEPKSISIPITITNLLSEAKEILLKATCPRGWRYSILFREYNVSKIFLKGNEAIDLVLVLEPGPEVTTGQYHFNISAYSNGRMISNILNIGVKILTPTAAISIETTTSEVSGSPGSIFSFRFNIKNNSYRDLTLSLNAEVPRDWYILGFKSYEGKMISDVTVRARSTYWSITLDVYCPKEVEPRVYPIKVTVSEPVAGIHEEFIFRAAIIGTPKIELTTESELLSYNVEAGGEIEIPLIIKNTGTASVRDIDIYCRAPSGWKTAVLPNKIPSLPMKEKANVVLYISPPPGAIAGDYSIYVRAWSMDASQEIALRITVTKTTYWGIIGIVVIVAAVFGLIMIFWRYGRL